MERKIKNIDQRASLNPSENAWLKIERKLNRTSYRGKLNKYRNLAVAAIGLLVISLTVLFSFFIQSNEVENSINSYVAYHYELQDLQAAADAQDIQEKIKILTESYRQAGSYQ